MLSLGELKDSARDSLERICKKEDVKEAEVFASSSEFSLMRICFSTNIPSNALEEPKSGSSFGIGVRVLFKDGSVGFGKFDSSICRKAALAAYDKAKRNKVFDKDFKSLPSPMGKAKGKPFSDKRIFSLSPEKAVDLSYECLSGALDNIPERAGNNVNITGELDFCLGRMAIANSNGIFAFDENTSCFASLTTIIEGKEDVAGTWMDCSTSIKKLNPYLVGKESVEKALLLRDGSKISSGSYDVVFGSLAFADLVYSRLALTLDSIEFNSTPYADSLGKKIAAESFNVSDDGNLNEGIASRRFTDEGLPAGKTVLIREGFLEDFISNDYYAKKFSSMKNFLPKNGFRHGGYASEPSISFTNLVVGKGNHSSEELVSEVRNGIYIGRIWYTYPLNGLASADFTSTIRGDSYIIEKGEITKPLIPNTIRINDNFSRIMQNIFAIGKKQKQVVAWGESHSVVTPEVAVRGVRLERIAENI